MRRKIWFAVLAIFLLTAGLFLALRAKRHPSKKEQPTALVSQPEEEEKVITLSGQVEAEEKVILRFQTSGRLAWVGVKEGDWVKKGQAIASLDQRELKKRLQKELNDYLKTRWDFEQAYQDYQYQERWWSLSDKVRRILEKHQFDLNNAVLDVELAELALRFATITTPIEGIVTRVDAPFAGVNITPATAEFEIVNPKSAYFSVQADEEEVVKIKKGMEAKISLDAYPDQIFSGQVVQVAFAPQKTSGGPSWEVKIKFKEDNSDLKFRLGMEGEAEIQLP